MSTKPLPAPVAQSGLAVKPDAEQILAEFVSQLSAIPGPAEDDGLGMVYTILGATSWEQLQDEASKLPDSEKVAGRRLKINNIERHDSTIVDGLTPFFLVIDSTDIDTGEMVMWQTSAQTVMAKLVRLYHLGSLPAIVETRKAVTPTRSGFYPINLIVHSVSQ